MGCGGSEENKGEMDLKSGYPAEFNNFIAKSVKTKEHEEFTKLGVYLSDLDHSPETAQESEFKYSDQFGKQHEVIVLTTSSKYSIIIDRVEGKSQMYEGEFKQDEKSEQKYQKHGKGRLIYLDETK